MCRPAAPGTDWMGPRYCVEGEKRRHVNPREVQRRGMSAARPRVVTRRGAAAGAGHISSSLSTASPWISTLSWPRATPWLPRPSAAHCATRGFELKTERRVAC